MPPRCGFPRGWAAGWWYCHCSNSPVGACLAASGELAFKFRRFRRGSSMRDLWQIAGVWHVGVLFPPANQEAMEPEHPKRSGDREREDEADLRVHVLHTRRKGDEAGSSSPNGRRGFVSGQARRSQSLCAKPSGESDSPFSSLLFLSATTVPIRCGSRVLAAANARRTCSSFAAVKTSS